MTLARKPAPDPARAVTPWPEPVWNERGAAAAWSELTGQPDAL